MTTYAWRIATATAVLAALGTSQAIAGDDASDLRAAVVPAYVASAELSAADAAAYAAQDEPGPAYADPAWRDQEGWRFAVTPYLYLPAFDGELKYQIPPGSGLQPTVNIDAKDILEDLDFAFMGTAEAHKGRYGLLTDLMYVDLDSDADVARLTGPRGRVEIPINLDTSVGVKSWLWTLVATVTMGEPGSTTVEGFAGFRYLQVETDLDWSFEGPFDLFPQAGSLSEEEDVWDFVGGVRGETLLGASERWKLTYYVDVGGGDSQLTWQAVGGIGYGYGWGDLRFAWRYISYEQGPTELIQDLTLSGPAFGATFRF